MRQDSALSRLVAGIYDAVLDPASWPEVLAASAAYVGGQSAALASTDTVSKACTVHHQFGFDRRYVQRYEGEYWKFDPVAPSPYLPTEKLTSVSDYLSDHEFRGGRFCQEWLEPQDWIDGTSVVLERSATSCSIFVVARHRTRGFVDDEMSERMLLIAPHIRRAVAISNVIDRAQAKTATFADILDGLSAAVFLMDADGRIVHANVAGRTTLAANDFLYAASDRLVARDAAIDGALRAEFAAAARHDPAVRGRGITVSLISSDCERYVAHVLPLISGAGHRGIANSAVAALFVRKAAVEKPSLPESIARYYKLTPTEIRVLEGIVEVGGGPEVAGALGVAGSTVKTHLHRLYQKTGTRRQTDLVKLVTGFSSLLLS
jgi:DNA-binding CsgD family transcriptional regulator